MSMNINLGKYLTREGRIAKVTNINKDGSCTGEIDGVDVYMYWNKNGRINFNSPSDHDLARPYLEDQILYILSATSRG